MTWRLTTIVSTAGAGAERGGRDAAIELGLTHGGWRPAGYELPAIYAAGMRETSSANLGMAKRLNVQDSDATLVVSFDSQLRGEALFVERTAEQLRRGYLHVVLPVGGRSQMPNVVAQEIVEFLADDSVAVLHVAGPSEAEEPGIQEATRDLLVWVLEDQVDVAERSKPVATEIEKLAAEIAGGVTDRVTDSQLEAAMRSVPLLPLPETDDEP